MREVVAGVRLIHQLPVGIDLTVDIGGGEKVQDRVKTVLSVGCAVMNVPPDENGWWLTSRTMPELAV
ncbi:hypothetical protein ACH419_31235 [Streptomyces bobili]|uniref:hypothetical protein n=1 Tax=Streptomyces bobili TaxID=67280 RepID=UPI0037A2B4F2